MCVCVGGTLVYEAPQWEGLKKCEYGVLRVCAPLLGVLHDVRSKITTIPYFFQDKSLLQRDIQRLEISNQKLRAQNMALNQALFRKNQHEVPMSEALSAYVTPHLLKKAVYADVVQSITLSKPFWVRAHDQQLLPNSVVLGRRGLLGRATSVRGDFAHIQSIFDVSSRIPVDIHGIQAVAAGQNSSHLKLIHTKDVSMQSIQEGDIVYTSGFGGIFPKGIKLGRVVRRDHGVCEIQPEESHLKTPHTVMILPPQIDADALSLM